MIRSYTTIGAEKIISQDDEINEVRGMALNGGKAVLVENSANKITKIWNYYIFNHELV